MHDTEYLEFRFFERFIDCRLRLFRIVASQFVVHLERNQLVQGSHDDYATDWSRNGSGSGTLRVERGRSVSLIDDQFFDKEESKKMQVDLVSALYYITPLFDALNFR